MPRDYPAPPAPLLDRAFVAPSVDKRDSLLFEAQAVTNIFLLDNLLAKERDLRAPATRLRNRADRFIVAMMFRVRQLSDSSEAVRTPSFNPSLRWEQHFLRADTVPLGVAGSRRWALEHISDKGYRVEWTHHSNGQAGCFRSGYISDATGDPDNCTPGPNADLTGIGLNRASGDFSTTYWGATGFWRRVAIDSALQREKWVLEGSLQYQLHKWGGPGDMRQEQRDLYGSNRVRADASYRISHRAGPWFHWLQWRVDALGELGEKMDSRLTPWRAHLDLSVRSPATLGAGLIVRMLDGHDYYNIGFATRRTRILFGVLLDPSGLESPQ